MRIIRKIVSGGQTSADRAALDFAMGRGIPHGGGCPNGRRAEDGRVVWMQPGDITDHDHRVGDWHLGTARGDARPTRQRGAPSRAGGWNFLDSL